MKTISIKELHDRIGHWLRRVRVDGEIVVTERGTPVVRMVPPARPAMGSPFSRRKLLPGVAQLDVARARFAELSAGQKA